MNDQLNLILHKVHLVGLITYRIAMHGQYNIKFINAQQAKQRYKYKNIKEELYKWDVFRVKYIKKVHLVGLITKLNVKF